MDRADDENRECMIEEAYFCTVCHYRAGNIRGHFDDLYGSTKINTVTKERMKI